MVLLMQERGLCARITGLNPLCGKGFCYLISELKECCMRLVVVVCFMLVLSVMAKADDVGNVVLKNDSTFSGKVVSNTASEIVLEFKDGSRRTFRRTAIRDFTVSKVVSRSERMKLLPESPAHFSCFGATLGRQALLNLRGGEHDSSFATHISGMFYSAFVGLQGNLMWCFWQQNHTQHYLSAMAGYQYADLKKKFLWYEAGRNEWTFEGIGYVLHSREFLLEVGVAWPNGTTSKPQWLLQVGWVPKKY